MVGFEQYERMIDELEGQVESYESSESMTLHEEFQTIQQDEELDEELENLKSRMNRESKEHSEEKQAS